MGLLSAVDFLHQKNLIHRDIKVSSNVIPIRKNSLAFNYSFSSLPVPFNLLTFCKNMEIKSKIKFLTFF